MRTLSKTDTFDLLEFLAQALQCRTESAFKRLVLDLQALIDFEYAVCGQGNLAEVFRTSQVKYDFIKIKYPQAYLQRYLNKGYHRRDPMVQGVLSTREVQNWREVRKKRLPHSQERIYADAEAFGLRDGYTYGCHNVRRDVFACFFFGGRKVENDARTRYIIKTVVPHLSRALDDILETRQTNNKNPLTPREIQILQWLMVGKTSWEISRILKISERTVNFHANNAKRKLGAVNRLQAVALALGNGFISF